MNSLPGFQDWRRTEDGVMVADLGFKKQLQALDPELDVVWDWGSARWEIWKFPGQGKEKKKRMNPRAFHIMKVETKGKKFRELGADLLVKLQMGDTHKFSTNQLVDYFNKMDDNIQREKRNNLHREIGAMAKEQAWYMGGNPYRASVPKRFMEGTKFLLEGPSKKQKMMRAING